MNRQKRDRIQRAYNKGHHAGANGQGKESCPYNTIEHRQQWLGGWREACESKAAGFMVR